jgi:hypothetical protein
MPGVKRFTLARFNAASLAAFTVALSLIVSCEQHRDIVGKWRASNDPNAVVWEFANNGAVTIGNARGRYSFGDNNRIKIEMPSGKSVYQTDFPSPDQMTFRESTGSKLMFTRVK